MSSTIRRVINVSTDEVYGESSLGAEKGTVRIRYSSHTEHDCQIWMCICHTHTHTVSICTIPEGVEGIHRAMLLCFCLHSHQECKCAIALLCSIDVIQALLRAAHWNLPTLIQLPRLEQR